MQTEKSITLTIKSLASNNNSSEQKIQIQSPLMRVDEDIICSSYAPSSYAQTHQSLAPVRPRRMQSLNLPKSHRTSSDSAQLLNSTNYGAIAQDDEGYSMIITSSINERNWRESSRIQTLVEKPSLSLVQSMIESFGPIPHDYRNESTNGSRECNEDAGVDEDMKNDGENTENDRNVDLEQKSKISSKKRLSSVWLAGWNVFNFIQGIGIMGIPYAFIGAGWLAIPITLIVGFMCCFSGKLIAECMYDRLPPRSSASPTDGYTALETRQRQHRTYTCVAGAAFPKFGRQITAAVLLTELIGASILYTILLGTSIYAIATHLQIGHTSISLCMVVFGYLSYPLLMITTMRIVAWFSILSVTGLMLSVVAVLAGSGMESQAKVIHWEALLHPSPQMIPVSLGIILFSFCAHAVLPGIECTMQKPELYPRMLNITFTGATIVKIILGGICALTFGTEVKQAATDNIVNFPTIAIVAHASVAINVFFSLPLIFFIVGEQLDYFIDKYASIRLARPKKCPILYAFWIFASRGSILSFVLLVGLLLPQFALIMGMIGALTGSLLCFIFPSMFHLKLFWLELNLCEKISRFATLLLGVIAGVIGFVCSALELRDAFNI